MNSNFDSEEEIEFNSLGVENGLGVNLCDGKKEKEKKGSDLEIFERSGLGVDDVEKEEEKEDVCKCKGLGVMHSHIAIKVYSCES